MTGESVARPPAGGAVTGRRGSERGWLGGLGRRRAGIALLLLAVALGAVVGSAWAAWPRHPGDDSAEAGFLRDMSSHHAQAVEMAMTVQRTTTDEDLRLFATDIALTQQAELGTMDGWLEAWGLPATGTEPPMAWMGHPVEGRMPGMASPEQLDQLRTASPAEADVLFLQLMTTHHRAGVEMAAAVLERDPDPLVRRMAERIVANQGVEIATMQGMLAERGQPTTAETGESVPASGHGEHGTIPPSAGAVSGTAAASGTPRP